MSLSQTFGANVRHYRKASGMKQPEFAAATGLSVAMVGKIERGDTPASFESVEKIAAALDVPEVVLFANSIMIVPTGERGQLLQRINILLSKFNNKELARAAKMLTAVRD